MSERMLAQIGLYCLVIVARMLSYQVVLPGWKSKIEGLRYEQEQSICRGEEHGIQLCALQ